MLFGIGSTIGAVLAVVLWVSKSTDSTGNWIGWQAHVAVLLPPVMAAAAIRSISRSRRLVYGIPSRDELGEQILTWAIQQAQMSAASTTGPYQKRPRRLAEEQIFFIVAGLAQLVVAPVVVWHTLSDAGWSWLNDPFVADMAVFGSVCIVVLTAWALVAWYDEVKRDAWLQAAIGEAALAGNIYLGYALWVVAIKWFKLYDVGPGSHVFGLLIWWNLLDSVPLVDIDGALDWEKPIEEYGAGVGTLLLVQRIALFATLVRSVQLVVDVTIARSRTPNRSARP